MLWAVIDAVGGMHLQIVTSLGDSHPRTYIIREDVVCHHRTQIPRVQGVCTAIIVWDDNIEAAGRAQEPHLRDLKPLHFEIVATTAEGSGCRDQM